MQKKLNEFSILVSTVNGSGSATANNALMKAIFKMGIPISARNIFPSNIQGLPTWYSLRVSEKRHLARVDEFDILINLDKVVLADDLKKVKKGGLVLCDQPLAPIGGTISRNAIADPGSVGESRITGQSQCIFNEHGLCRGAGGADKN